MAAVRENAPPIAKVALTAAAGATIEWYDFFVYGTAAALVFPRLFFPGSLSPFVAQIAAFATFAVGFLARPFGGMIFGHFGDLYGRKRALVIALFAMGGATTLIGLLPTYATAGAAAPLLLVVLRIIQGLALGGQWGGAVLLTIENSREDRKGYYGSFVQIGVPVGLVLANVVFLVLRATLQVSQFDSWGWRIPFLLSVALICVSSYIQIKMQESIEFNNVLGEETRTASFKCRPKSPVVSVITDHPVKVALAGGAFLASNICFYIAVTYVIVYWTAVLHHAQPQILGFVMISGVAMVPALIVSGRVSDSWGRTQIFMWGAVLSGLWSLVFFPLLEMDTPLVVAGDITIELVLLSLMYGPQAALFAELFPVQIRYSGASLGYQLGSVAGGGLAPVVATTLLARFRTSYAIALYMLAACAISFFCTLLLSRSIGGRSRRSFRPGELGGL